TRLASQAQTVISHPIQYCFAQTSCCATPDSGTTSSRSMRGSSSMRSEKRTSCLRNRAGEKGAALVTAVLLSMLLLAAGGTLVLTSTMTGITARDSTAEMQAYYAAEAGVARTLEVLRGNVQSNPAGTRAPFKNVLCSKTLWTTTSGNEVN